MAVPEHTTGIAEENAVRPDRVCGLRQGEAGAFSRCGILFVPLMIAAIPTAVVNLCWACVGTRLTGFCWPPVGEKEKVMDRQRVKGGIQKATGNIKETAGKALGDRHLEGEGKADKAE